MIVGVLADTHIPKRARSLPLQAYQQLQKADAIIHAGDVLVEELLRELETLAPVYAVKGNNDGPLDLPPRLDINLAGVQIGVVHETGQSEGRGRRLKRLFPESKVVVFGHSHIPTNEWYEDLLLFNPGSPTDKRRQPDYTMGLLHLTEGSVTGEIVTLS